MYVIFLCLLLKKVALLFCSKEARETSHIWDIFKNFLGLNKQIQGRFRTQKNPGIFQDVATLSFNTTPIKESRPTLCKVDAEALYLYDFVLPQELWIIAVWVRYDITTKLHY